MRRWLLSARPTARAASGICRSSRQRGRRESEPELLPTCGELRGPLGSNCARRRGRWGNFWLLRLAHEACEEAAELAEACHERPEDCPERTAPLVLPMPREPSKKGARENVAAEKPPRCCKHEVGRHVRTIVTSQRLWSAIRRILRPRWWGRRDNNACKVGEVTRGARHSITVVAHVRCDTRRGPLFERGIPVEAMH